MRLVRSMDDLFGMAKTTTLDSCPSNPDLKGQLKRMRIALLNTNTVGHHCDLNNPGVRHR